MPLALQQVSAVDRRGHHVDDDLARARPRIGNLLPGEYFRTTRLTNDDGMHASTVITEFSPAHHPLTWYMDINLTVGLIEEGVGR